jgi:ABC-2 type transport system ATP-binding protein
VADEHVAGLSWAVARQRTAELLERFDLNDAADKVVRGYSGGMRRKLDLAVSLIGRPSVLFLDEPTTGLDPASSRVKTRRGSRRAPAAGPVRIQRSAGRCVSRRRR